MRLAILVLCLGLPLAMEAQQQLIPQQIGSVPLTRDEAAAQRNNQLSLGVTSTETVDDHPPGTAAGSNDWGVLSSISPEVSLQIDRARLKSVLQYSPTASYSTAQAISNMLSHTAGMNLQYRFTKRLTLGVHETYILTSDPFDSLRASADLSGFGFSEKPNAATLGTNLHSRSEQVGSDLNYRLRAHTMIGAGGTFGDNNYRSVEAPGAGSLHSQTWSSFGYVGHMLTPRYAIAVQYTAQSFNSDTPISAVTSTGFGHEVLGFWNVTWNRNIQFSVFAGADFLQVSYLAGTLPALGISPTVFAGGAAFNWQGEHNGLGIHFAQEASNSGIAGAGVFNMRQGDIALRRRFGRLWHADVFANYAAETQLGNLSFLPAADSVSAGTRLTRNLTPRLDLSITAFRQQFIGNVPSLFLERNHDVVAVALGYRMSRPVGR
jgi:hypothetical protein